MIKLLRLSRRAPLAEDLRRVIVALKVASTLERVGDLAKNIAKKQSNIKHVLKNTDVTFYKKYDLYGS